MFAFLIKKAFFDLWDNFLLAMALNLGFIVIMTVPLILPSVAAGISGVLGLVVLVAGVLLAMVFLGGVYRTAREVTDYRTPGWNAFLTGLRENLVASLLLGGIGIAHVVLISVAVPVYTAMANGIGLFALALLFWISLIWILSVQYFFPVHDRMDRKVGKVLKKIGLLSLDNTLFTIGLSLGALVILGASVFTAFLFPGVTGLAIWYHSALKLRLYKYDYLEENPEANRKEIPWDALLYDDRERVGTRTLKGMIFPWRD